MNARLPILILVLGAIGGGFASGQPAAPDPAPAVAAVAAVAITVSDLDQAVAWYTDVLTFEKVSEREISGADVERALGLFGVRARVARLRLGSENIELWEFLAPRGRPYPREACSQDRSFQHLAIVVADMARAYAVLRRHKVEHLSPEPQRLPDWNADAGGIEAFYFRDPDGHPLELFRFPEGKGDPRWRETDGRLFLGIDHTAIVVEDTEAALAFYRDLLGMRVAGKSENHGPEQERLNAVFGARLRITALRAKAGPGVELLEYLSPGDGRAMPADEKPSDILHRRTVLHAPDAAGLARALRRSRAPFVSTGIAAVPGEGGEAPAAFLVRDSSGHVIEVRQP